MPATNKYLPCETPVLHIGSNKIGSVMNGFAGDASGWTEYEVATPYGIERWRRSDMVVVGESNRQPADDFSQR